MIKVIIYILNIWLKYCYYVWVKLVLLRVVFFVVFYFNLISGWGRRGDLL